MSRPRKCRRVTHLPQVNYFKPAGIPMRVLDEVVLSVEEAEAIRLKDLERLEQEQGAERMNISRPTFQRVLVSGRQKMADALLNGKAIRIEGGSFEIAPGRFRCFNDHEWEVPSEIMMNKPPQFCPTCNSTDIESLSLAGFGGGGRGRGQHRERRQGRRGR